MHKAEKIKPKQSGDWCCVSLGITGTGQAALSRIQEGGGQGEGRLTARAPV